VVLPNCIDFSKAVHFDEQSFLVATRAAAADHDVTP